MPAPTTSSSPAKAWIPGHAPPLSLRPALHLPASLGGRAEEVSLRSCPEKVLQLPLQGGEAARLSLGFPIIPLSQVIQSLPGPEKTRLLLAPSPSQSSFPSQVLFSLRTFAIQSQENNQQLPHHPITSTTILFWLMALTGFWFFFQRRKKIEGGRCWVWGEGRRNTFWKATRGPALVPSVCSVCREEVHLQK